MLLRIHIIGVTLALINAVSVHDTGYIILFVSHLDTVYLRVAAAVSMQKVGVI